ncbi:hypothetical protein D3C76_1051730 [compost metagenome]
MKFLALAPVVHQHAFLGRAVGQQQAAVITRLAQVSINPLLTLVSVNEVPALVQVVPVHLSAILWNLGCLAGESQLAGQCCMLASEAMGAWFIVQGPYQARELLAMAATQLGQRLERFERECARTHGRYGVQVVMQQTDGVENALDDPQLVHFQQVNRGWAPPVAFG